MKQNGGLSKPRTRLNFQLANIFTGPAGSLAFSGLNGNPHYWGWVGTTKLRAPGEKGGPFCPRACSDSKPTRKGSHRGETQKETKVRKGSCTSIGLFLGTVATLRLRPCEALNQPTCNRIRTHRHGRDLIEWVDTRRWDFGGRAAPTRLSSKLLPSGCFMSGYLIYRLDKSRAWFLANDGGSRVQSTHKKQ